ncbi:hypothetical protein GPK34_00565 [Secundilactobacillus kimchicus]|uniref:HU family DNA-binding protein n=1 Tax=Secundilactobacillus kimchicus TaxID=528209 RepID=UPI001C02ADD6|nr:HU family DNA-binding protein [Secundilactobacillus kimchicus]MBT9670530.1 hypothetical protein [Secundilactobacillus kimchicus]
MSSINNHTIAQRINEINPDYLIKDLDEILRLEQAVIKQALRNDEVIKWGDLYKFSTVQQEAHQHYDGIHKKMIDLPAKRLVKEHQLKGIKNLN